METIDHEYYVSLEVAKLLKQAGFDWEIDTFYLRYYEGDGHDNSIPTEEFVLHNTDYAHCSNWNNTILTYINGILHKLSAPTLDVAQRWLREVKNIFIEVTRYETIHPLARELFEAVYDKTVDKSFAYGVNVLDANNESIYDEDCFLTYEEAQEAGIKKALEIILEEGK